MASKLSSSTAAPGIEVAAQDQGVQRAVLGKIRAASTSARQTPKPTSRKKVVSATQHAKPASKPATSEITKAELILKKLRTTKGASIEMLSAETGWQAHSVRGFLSAVVKKKLALNLVSDIGKDSVRRYRIVSDAQRA
jgi:hypothetical protein